MTLEKKRICCIVMAVVIALTTIIAPLDWRGVPVTVDAAETVATEKYLDECTITTFDQYDDNEGDSFIYPIGQHRYSRGNIDINGISYSHGIEAWIARWNYTPEQSWASATFDVGRFTGNLIGQCVLIDSYNTTNFDTTAYFYGDGNLLASYNMKSDNIPFSINIEMENVKELRIYVEDNDYFVGGTSFGFTEMKLTGNGKEWEEDADGDGYKLRKYKTTFYNGKYDKSIDVEFDWGFSLFEKDPSVYDHNIAKASLLISEAAYGEAAIEKQLKGLGFRQGTLGYYGDWTFLIPPTTVASQSFDANGVKKTIVAVVIRGTSNISDWLTDFTDGVDGFTDAAEYAYSCLLDYCDKQNINLYDENTILFINGHSLGGATAGRLAWYLKENNVKANTFVYAIAPAASAMKSELSGCNYNYIHNIINTGDVVPKLPPSLWAGHFGNTYWYSPELDIYDDNKKKLYGDDADNIIDPLFEHHTATYLYCMLTSEPYEKLPSGQYYHRGIKICCPVDVTVLDVNGNIIGYTEGKNVKNNKIESAIIMCNEDEKYVYLPKDSACTIKIDGTGDGEMEYSVQSYNEYMELLETKSFQNIVIKEGKQFKSVLTPETEILDLQLWVCDKDEMPTAEVMEDGREIDIPNPHPHLYTKEQVTKQPTCTQTGTKLLTCEICGRTKTEEIEKTEHKYIWVTDKFPTQTEEGSKHQECQLCGDKKASVKIPIVAGANTNNISYAVITLSQNSYTYDGSAKKPSVTVNLNGKTLRLNTDYIVAYSKNINIGTAKVTIVGKGNYTGNKTVNFAIVKAAAGADTPITCKKTSYKVAYGAKPFKINAASKGTLSFTSSNPEIAAVDRNTGKVTIKGTGVVTITVTAGINSVKLTVKVTPKKQSLKSAKAAKGRKLNIKWADTKHVTGYQVQVSTDKNFKKIVKQKNVTNNAYTFTKLKAGKKYYVRVRSYKRFGIETLYGAWSNVKRSNKIKN